MIWLTAAKLPEPATVTSHPSLRHAGSGHASPEGGSRQFSRPKRSAEVPDEMLDQWLRRASKDTPATLAEVIKLADEEQRGELLEWILTAWMTDGRRAALSWLAENVASMESDLAEEVVDLVIGDWGAVQPHEAMAWVNRNLGAARREMGLRCVASHWAAVNPDAMSEWIRAGSLKEELWRDELVDEWIRVDPARTMEWCQSDPDKSWAEGARQMVIQSWLINAPEAANAYLHEHPDLVPEVRPEEPPPSLR